jgi:hypothetical protein
MTLKSFATVALILIPGLALAAGGGGTGISNGGNGSPGGANSDVSNGNTPPGPANAYFGTGNTDVPATMGTSDDGHFKGDEAPERGATDGSVSA